MVFPGLIALLTLVANTFLTPPAPRRAQSDVVGPLLVRLEQAATAGDVPGILSLCEEKGDSQQELATALARPVPSRIVIAERDRAALDSQGLRVMIEVLTERGMEGAVSTWRLDVRPGRAPADGWHISAVTRLSVVTGLYRLSLNPSKQFDVHDLTVRAPDMTLTIRSGSAFVSETAEGPTAVVLLGRGQMRFAPPAEAERTQVRIFGGSDILATDVDAAFIRVKPGEFSSMFDPASLVPRATSPDDLRRATGVFEDYIGRTLQIDLSGSSRDRWSLTPPFGDVIMELRTRRFGTLTYARSGGDAEDISVFDRKRRHNISIYSSAAKLAGRGPFYNEDNLVDYDVLAYDLDVEVSPDREFISGSARLKIRVLAAGTSTLTFRLAESLVVRGVYSPDFGRLLHLRVVGQTSVIVNLPTIVTRDTELWIDVEYAGRLPGQTYDREALVVGQDPQEPVFVPTESRLLYSNRSYWYPQSPVTDYATATMRVTVPAEYTVIASGDPVGPPAAPPGVADPGRRRLLFVFDAARPARYLACVISRFNTADPRRIVLDGGQATDRDAARRPGEVSLLVRANPRQAGRVREKSEEAAAIIRYYASIAGDAPYPSFTLALTEAERPGGHSPPYFAVLNQVVSAGFVWRNDPVSFDNYPTFFLAHELAHQWWGHAVGWKNYHEQWISEGFAQYFAALYAERSRPGQVFAGLIRQMRQTAIASSREGPVYLGYRLGHIQQDDRIFRAIVYNKGAMVLHMLRRLLGDTAFFSGLRAFYQNWKFTKAGTDDFRQAMERAGGRDLHRFFETWIYGATIPRVRFGYRITGQDAQLRFDQLDDPVDMAMTVTVSYANGSSEETVVELSEKTTERTIALKSSVRVIAANADNGALVEIER